MRTYESPSLPYDVRQRTALVCILDELLHVSALAIDDKAGADGQQLLSDDPALSGRCANLRQYS